MESPNQAEAIIFSLPHAKFSIAGLELYQGMSIEEWLQVGKLLRNSEQAIQWALGDWLNFGEAQYGELYAQALSATDYTYESLQNLKYVAKAIPHSRRHESLAFSTHAAVASLEPEQQDKILLDAEENNLSRKDVRAAVQAVKAPVVFKEKPIEIEVKSTQDMVENLDEWIKDGIDLNWDYLGYNESYREKRPDGLVSARFLFKVKE